MRTSGTLGLLTTLFMSSRAQPIRPCSSFSLLFWKGLIPWQVESSPQCQTLPSATIQRSLKGASFNMVSPCLLPTHPTHLHPLQPCSSLSLHPLNKHLLSTMTGRDKAQSLLHRAASSVKRDTETYPHYNGRWPGQGLEIHTRDR